MENELALFVQELVDAGVAEETAILAGMYTLADSLLYSYRFTECRSKLASAFIWADTPEGPGFWSTVDRKARLWART